MDHNGTIYSCVKLVLRPEDGGQNKETWEVTARVKHPTALPASFLATYSKKKIAAAEAACATAGGVFARLDKLQRFINDAVSGEETPVAACDAAAQGETPPPSESPLGRAIAMWNDRFFNMNSAVTRQNADRFHGRGTERKHLAQEVTHFVMPTEVQARISERLATHRKALFGDEGAGQGGTTGAHFLSGNVGFGNANQGANLMDLVFPPAAAPPQKRKGQKRPAADAALDGDGDEYAKRRGGHLFGEVASDAAANASSRPPDLVTFEEEIRRLLLQRSDLTYLLGEDVSIEWQHRLWRYGPHFDPKAKGGIWHKDTCPFGINGALPENSIMFTIVYILYTENLDGPTAGTRVKDDDGTSVSLPCVAGEGNVIRSGESDGDAFLHSGPLNIRKLDPTRPAYRVMLQSKALVRPVDGRRRAIPSKGNWRGLGIEPLALDARATAAEQVGALSGWLRRASERLTSGVGESNAVGFEAYPVNVGRAWAVTSDLCAFLGMETAGLLPEPFNPATPVVVFGWDQRYTRTIVDTLAASSFRVLNVASDADFAELRRTNQEAYSNLETADIDDAKRVSALLSTYPYDMHLILDVPPLGERALSEPLLARYGALFTSLAAKREGEGRLSTITLLSQQMPVAGRTSAGARLDAGADGGPPPSELQRAFAELEASLVAFGEAHGVRVVIMRVADRVYAPLDSALSRVAAPTAANPCRVETCTETEPITRIHAEDLSAVLRRMLAMFDMVATHGKDSSMRGTAAMAQSIARFPTGTVLEVVDDAPAASMRKAELLARVIMGVSDMCSAAACANLTAEAAEGMRPHRAAKGRNADLKEALGMPHLRYPTMHHGASKMFGAGEL